MDGDLLTGRVVDSGLLMAAMMDSGLLVAVIVDSGLLIAVIVGGVPPVVVASCPICRLGAINGVTMHHKIWPGAVIVQHKGWRVV